VCGGNRWCAEHISVQAAAPDQARDEVRRYAQSGVDQLTMVFNRRAQPEPLAEGVAAAIIDEAHKRRLRVFLESPLDAADVPSLTKWGIDGFLQPPGNTADPTGVLQAAAGKKGLPIAITLGDVEERQRLTAQVSVQDLERYRLMRQNTLAALKLGAIPVFGADLGDKRGLTPREVIRITARSMAGLGLSNEAILRAATRDAARKILGREDLGTLEPGKVADIIMVDGDPLRDLEALSRVELVIKGGAVVFDQQSAAAPGHFAGFSSARASAVWGTL
jgi:hypothetical protein